MEMYSNLEQGEFRLVTLQARFRGTNLRADQAHEKPPIHCDLNTFRNDEKILYQALSYTWGETTDISPIYVNNVEVQVTKNLEVALDNLREDYSDIILWIDALCINQSDEKEKSEQVKQMKEIYSNASTTIAWLGPSENSSKEAMKELRRVGTNAYNLGILDHIKEMGKSRPQSNERLQTAQAIINKRLLPFFEYSLQNPPRTHDLLISIQELLLRQYWSRVWILQEFVVSNKLHIRCGKQTIEFDHLHCAVMAHLLMSRYIVQGLFQRYTNLLERSAQSEADVVLEQMTNLSEIRLSTRAVGIFGMRQRYQFASIEQDGNQTLLYFLAKTQVALPFGVSYEATLDKDRIFAMLGMSNDKDDLNININYSKDKTCSEVYTEAARAIIATGTVDLLSMCQNRGRSNDVPSWVPDWRFPILRPCAQLHWFTPYNVSEGQSFRRLAKLNFLPPDETCLQGYLVDVIEDLETPWRPDPVSGCVGNLSDIAQYLGDVKELCKASDIKVLVSGINVYENISDRDTAHIHVPIGGQEQCGITFQRATEVCHRGHAGMLEYIIRHNVGQPAIPFTSDELNYQNMMGWQQYRRPFISIKGYVGLAPDHAQKGDVIVIFFGGKIPYVLRKNDKGTYYFVGESYVHGIMYGEFMRNKLNSIDFILK